MEEIKSASKIKISLRYILREQVSLIILVLMIIIGTVSSEAFFSYRNLINVLRQTSIVGILACGFGMVFLMGGFDLSMGAVLSLCACLVIGFMKATSFGVAVIITVATGIILGLLNGFLITLTKGDTSETFLITLGTSLLVFSIALTYTGGYNLYFDSVAENSPFIFFGQGYVWKIPFPVLLFFLLLVSFQVILKKTMIGRKIYLIGGNKKASYLSGINVRRIKIIVFTIAGFCSAVSGIILASRTTAAAPRAGEGYEFDAVIAIIIGGMKIGGGKGGMGQVIVGALILGLITNILNLAGVNPVNQIIIKGLILLGVIVLDAVRSKESV
jgi:ribose transport system permease protein